MVTQKPDWYTSAEPELHAIVEGFANRVRKKLETDPSNIIRRVNPFLLRARNANNPVDLAWRILDAFTFQSEATMFGKVVESLAITVCKHAYGGWKSMTPGIDLEYIDKNDTRVGVQIKSGENWGNSGERKQLEQSFQTARRILNQQSVSVRCIEGCSYGRSRKKDLGNFEQIVGIAFWEEITGWKQTASEIFSLIADHAENGMHTERVEAHARVLDCLKKNGIAIGNSIRWEQLLMFVMSGGD